MPKELSEYPNLHAELHPSWAREGLPACILGDNGLYDLYDFFVLHSPCSSQSCRSHDIASKWGRGPWSSPRHLKRPLSIELFGTGEAPLHNAKSRKELSGLFKDHALEGDLSEIALDRPRAAYTRANHPNSNVFMSLFCRIRNSLAHGRFLVREDANGELVFLFEDGKANESKCVFDVTCRGVIGFHALVRGIEFLKDGTNTQLKCEE